jgi:hypothetical protein
MTKFLAVALVLLLNCPIFADLPKLNRREFFSSCAAGAAALVNFKGDSTRIPHISHLDKTVSLRTEELKAAGYFGPETIRRQFAVFRVLHVPRMQLDVLSS